MMQLPIVSCGQPEFANKQPEFVNKIGFTASEVNYFTTQIFILQELRNDSIHLANTLNYAIGALREKDSIAMVNFNLYEVSRKENEVLRIQLTNSRNSLRAYKNQNERVWIGAGTVAVLSIFVSSYLYTH